MRTLGIAAAVVGFSICLYNTIKYERELATDKKDTNIRRQISEAIRINDITSIVDLIRQFSDKELVHFVDLYRDRKNSDGGDIWGPVVSALNVEIIRRGI